MPARIIPARAGFTGFSFGFGCVGWDHPRSRGVYMFSTVISRESKGSSPLARGLLGTDLDGFMGDRIIPARAGFTRTPEACERSPKDHPRSRGVYPGRTVLIPDGMGSSPLARGLQDEVALCRGDSVDHPRSRGVYSAAYRPEETRPGSSPLARGLHLRILGIPTNPYSTRPLLPSLPT